MLLGFAADEAELACPYMGTAADDASSAPSHFEQLPTMQVMPPETSVAADAASVEADPNLLAAFGAQTVVAATRSMPQLPKVTMGQPRAPFLTAPILAPPGLSVCPRPHMGNWAPYGAH